MCERAGQALQGLPKSPPCCLQVVWGFKHSALPDVGSRLFWLVCVYGYVLTGLCQTVAS